MGDSTQDSNCLFDFDIMLTKPSNHFGLRCTESDCKHINQIRNHSLPPLLPSPLNLQLTRKYRNLFLYLIPESKTFVLFYRRLQFRRLSLNYPHISLSLEFLSIKIFALILRTPFIPIGWKSLTRFTCCIQWILSVLSHERYIAPSFYFAYPFQIPKFFCQVPK